MKQLQNISVDANVMPPNTDFARLGLGPVTPLVMTTYYIIITNTNTKPGPESFPAMINLTRFLLGPSGKLVIIIIIYDIPESTELFAGPFCARARSNYPAYPPHDGTDKGSIWHCALANYKPFFVTRGFQEL